MKYVWGLAIVAALMVPMTATAEPVTVDARDIPTGILYDRVLPLSRAVDYDGTDAPSVSRSGWLQAYHEIYRASIAVPDSPDASTLRSRANTLSPERAIPIAIMHARYNRLRPGAIESGAAGVDDGRLVVERTDALVESELFAAAPMSERTFRGGRVSFVVDPSWYFAINTSTPRALDIDTGDGSGFRRARIGEAIPAAYATIGAKTIRVRVTLDDGRVLESTSSFRVESLQTPLPDDTLAVTATIPYNGGLGSGEAYVYLAPGHTAITRPLVVLEGFDIDNNMNWDELYALLNDENLLEDARAEGYDLVVLNFSDAKDYIQRNAFATVALIEEVQAAIAPTTTFALVGASMGGLCGRYALAYMETHAIAHRVRTYISFDTPHRGANIPLGVQYWLDFFSSEAAEAAALLASLDEPAARQMLAYHHQSPPTASGVSDPLRGVFLGELAGLGDYPATTRNVAMSNGSATMQTQGYNAGDQVIQWQYDSFLVDVRGNVWAVPDGGPGQILQAEINIILLPTDALNVTVSGTAPYDNAPGGWRSSLAQMDSVEAPYGDIVALHDNHCFIPTVSSLDLNTSDLFYDVDGDANILALTPFDAVYFPASNQPHVDITAENKQWLFDEVLGTPTAAQVSRAPGPLLRENVPNPFNPSTTIRFVLPAATATTLRVYDARGALVATLLDGVRPSGENAATWNGVDRHGQPVGSGVYFVRLDANATVRTQKIVLVK